ncbi:MAG: hypothetical protein MUP28_10265 [Candidatus Aminicenantes bacterium]|nr:hypothetical protein [Candidatus Aminicenantes bacterium]
MEADGRAQSQYYQTIAREFFRRRGAPFFLSPKDVALIARWEKMRVPLDAVLEGMETAFENFRKGGRSAKVLSLGFCEGQVMKAFGRHAERKAGGARKTVSRDEKKRKLIPEIERFLRAVPPGFEDLRASFERALVFIRTAGAGEEELERLDDGVDEALWRGASPEEKEALRRETAVEFAGKRGLDLEEVLRTRLVKALRDRHKVPYVSLFYY